MRGYILFGALCLASSPAYAGFFNSSSVANNAATQAAFRTAAGITTPEHFVDFESMTVGLNIHGNAALMPNLTLTTTNASALITTGTSSIGGSNPIDLRAVEMAEGNTVTLTFEGAADYIGGFDIDQAGMTVTVFFVGGGSTAQAFDTTAGNGVTAEFWGYVREANDPLITSVVFSGVSGDSGWGLDNLEYNGTPIPEPATMTILGIGALVAVRRRRAKK